MFEEGDDCAKQKYLKAQQNIDLLFHKLSELSSITDMDIKAVKSWDELKESIVKLQKMLTTLLETKDQLIAVNLQVHRFMTEYGSDLNYKSCSLKDDVTELYQRWEDIYEQNGTHLTELQTLNSQWNSFDCKFQSLHSKVKDAENISSTQDCDKKAHLHLEEVDPDFLQKDLNQLKLDLEFLQNHLKGVSSWGSVKHDLQDLQKRIQNQTHKLFASRNDDHSNSSTDEDDPDDHFEDAIQRLDGDSRYKRNKLLSPSHVESAKKDAINAKRKSSRFWRILRVAVPVQLTLVLLFCLACYLEPNCCDRLNNFSFSLTPHLRYLRGPPPV